MVSNFLCIYALMYIGTHVPIQKKILEMWSRKVFCVCFEACTCTGQVKKAESAV